MTTPDEFSRDELPLPPDVLLDAPPVDLDRLLDDFERWGDLNGEEPASVAADFASVQLKPRSDTDPPDSGLVDPWRVEDDETAEWMAAELAAAQGRLAGLSAQLQRYRDRFARWFAAGSRRDQARAEWCQAHLEDYALRQRRTADRATIHLPSGSIGTKRPKKPTVEVVDAAAFLDWARENLTPDEWSLCVKELTPEQSVLVSGVRKIVSAVERGDGYAVTTGTGELIPGLAAELGADTPTVSVR